MSDLVEPLADTHLLSGDSTITEVMRWLAVDPWLFVIDGQGISGVVTPSDLNRQAGRTYFYLLVAGFEIRLAAETRIAYSDQTEAVASLSAKNQDEVMSMFDSARTRDVEADLVSCMSLSHLVHIGAGNSDIRATFGFSSKKTWNEEVRPLPDFRNEVMHPAADA
jgi:hypothetical protein